MHRKCFYDPHWGHVGLFLWLCFAARRTWVHCRPLNPWGGCSGHILTLGSAVFTAGSLPVCAPSEEQTGGRMRGGGAMAQDVSPHFGGASTSRHHAPRDPVMDARRQFPSADILTTLTSCSQLHSNAIGLITPWHWYIYLHPRQSFVTPWRCMVDALKVLELDFEVCRILIYLWNNIFTCIVMDYVDATVRHLHVHTENLLYTVIHFLPFCYIYLI